MAKKTKATSTVDSLNDDYLEKQSIADDIFRQAAEEERKLTAAELQWMRKEMGWERNELSGQMRRANAVRRFQQISGTVEDRRQIKAVADTAATDLAERGAKLQAEIDAKQSQLRSIENDARISAKRLEEAEAAVSSLRDLAPDCSMACFNDHKRSINESVRAELHEVQGEIHTIEVRSTWDMNSGLHVSCARSVSPSFVEVGDGRMIRVTKKWFEYMATERERLPELKQKAAKLQAEYDEAIEEIQHHRNHYVI